MQNLILGASSGAGGRGSDGSRGPTPAAVLYVQDNVKRPSLNTLPPNAANAGPDSGSEISF
jgi:hypothetical protein